MIDLTPQGLSILAGGLISILVMLLPLVPVLKNKWDAATDEQKQAVNVIALLVVALGAGLASCFGGFDFMECTRQGWLNLAGNLFYAIIGNASVTVVFGKLGNKGVRKAAGFLYRK